MASEVHVQPQNPDARAPKVMATNPIPHGVKGAQVSTAFTTHPPNAFRRNSQQCTCLSHVVRSSKASLLMVLGPVIQHSSLSTATSTRGLVPGTQVSSYVPLTVAFSPALASDDGEIRRHIHLGWKAVSLNRSSRTPSSRPSSPRLRPPTAALHTNSRSQAPLSSILHPRDHCQIQATSHNKRSKGRRQGPSGGEACIQRLEHFGTMRRMGCGATNTTAGRERDLML